MDVDGRKRSDFQKVLKTRLDKCLSPTMDCPEKAIRAHSVQKSTTISLIEEDGHVYGILPKSSLEEMNFDFRKIGRNIASTFTGMCGTHDAEIFRPIDTQAIDTENIQQLFLLAYRSATREVHAAMEGAIRLQKAYTFEIAAKKLREDEPNALGYAAAEAIFKSWVIWSYRAEHYDVIFYNNRFDDIIHSHFIINDRRAVVASSNFFTIDDRVIRKGQPWIALNVIPTSTDKTLVLFSYPRRHSGAARRRLASVMLKSGDEKLLSLSTLMLDGVENFFLRPSHVDGWSDEKRNRILRDYVSTITEGAVLRDTPDFMLF